LWNFCLPMVSKPAEMPLGKRNRWALLSALMVAGLVTSQIAQKRRDPGALLPSQIAQKRRDPGALLPSQIAQKRRDPRALLPSQTAQNRPDPGALLPAQPRPRSNPADFRREFLSKFVAAAIERTHHTVRYDPAYVRIAYPGGDVPEGTGVCTDEVIRAYRAV